MVGVPPSLPPHAASGASSATAAAAAPTLRVLDTSLASLRSCAGGRGAPRSAPARRERVGVDA
ncbi:hypothetical protein [Phytohabitans suffuscus]|uniref:hypothetical protein n=1 Tax=Phytohabitans suffuscus TaxID=624315 RepID=UPI0015679B57|nr:hypothetical protein [Phytohabitans suffuscus]